MRGPTSQSGNFIHSSIREFPVCLIWYLYFAVNFMDTSEQFYPQVLDLEFDTLL